MPYPVPDNEEERLAALNQLQILDTAPEDTFDRIAEIARSVLDTPYSAISLMDDDRQWFKASCGWEISETPREESFCAQVVAEGKPIVIPDTKQDDRIQALPEGKADNRNLPDIRFYAGAPITIEEGYRIGSVCVAGEQPRVLDDHQRAVLSTLAQVAADLLEARHYAHQISYLTSALEQVDEPVFIIDGQVEAPHEARITWANQGYVDTTAYRRHDLIGKPPWILERLDEDARTEGDVREAFRSGKTVRGESVGRRKDGQPYVVSWILTPVRGDDDQVSHWVSVMRDVTGQKKREAQLEYEARHDPLTGLLNRSAVEGRVQRALERGNTGAALYIDLDRFKRINDTLGHQAGDAVLRNVARVLRETVRGDDDVARMGGDEFVVWAPGCTGDSAADLAERIAETLERTISINPETHEEIVYVSASVGVVPDASAYETADLLFRDADIAMYEAKTSPDRKFVRHEPAMTDHAERHLQLDAALHHGVENEEFVPFFHPIIRLDDGALVGFEVLARWRLDDGSLCPPSGFLEAAEETGLIVPIGHQVLEGACRAVSRLEAAHKTDLSVTLSGNFSRREFFRPSTYDFVASILGTYDIPPERFTMEITERVVGHDPEGQAETAERLKTLGINIQVDDFGTGYSSLHSLLEFPVDGLKIDKILTAEVAADRKGRRLTQAVVDMGRSLDLSVTAEGIETNDQLEALRELGCPYGQGFLFAQPAPAEELPELLDRFPLASEPM